DLSLEQLREKTHAACPGGWQKRRAVDTCSAKAGPNGSKCVGVVAAKRKPQVQAVGRILGGRGAGPHVRTATRFSIVVSWRMTAASSRTAHAFASRRDCIGAGVGLKFPVREPPRSTRNQGRRAVASAFAGPLSCAARAARHLTVSLSRS